MGLANKFRVSWVLWAAIGALVCPLVAGALTVPFVEDFTSDVAGWHDAPGTSLLTWQSTGGPDGGSYASTTFNFQNSTDIDTPALFRAQDEFNSSGGAFEGDWRTGVGGVSLYVRHDAPQPLQFFVRYADPANFPGFVSVVPDFVDPGVWTRIVIPIPDPDAVDEGSVGFDAVYDNIGHVQVGIFVTPELALQDVTHTFDIDKVGISTVFNVPAVSTWGLIVMSVVLLSAATVVIRRRTPRIVVS